MAMTTSDTALSLPTLAIKEALQQFVTVELRDGTVLRGLLYHVDLESGNVTLEDVHRREKDLAVSYSGRLVCRGHEIRLVSLPKAIQNAPFLKNASELIQAHLKSSRRRVLDSAAKAAKVAAKLAKKADAASAMSKKLLKKK